MVPIFLKAVGFSRAVSVCLSFFLSFSLTEERFVNGAVGLLDQPQSSSVSTSTTTSSSTINTSSTTTTTPLTPIVSTPTPLWRTQREAPQRYVFSFPAVNFDNNVYEQRLVIATTRPHNVTVNLVTTYMLLSAYGPYVINNTSAPLTLVLAQHGITSLHTSVMSVEITSSDVVNVYAFDYFVNNIDAILVRDVTQLGKRYSVMTLPFTRLANNRRSFFVVTASEDNTTVVIREPAGVDVDLSSTTSSSQSTVDGRMVTTTLNKLQTVSTIHDGDLTGLDIRSDKPQALSFGLNRNRMTDGCCWDHMWVQLPGVHVWGKEYVTFPTTAMGSSSTDVYYLAAAENDTVVSVDCDERLTLSDAYEWTSTALDTSSFHYLVSDKPFVVIKAVRGTRYVLDPCMLTLTDTSRWTTALTFALPTKALWDSASIKFTVTVITEKAQKDSLTINGEHLEANWKSISAGKGSSSRALVGGDLTGLSSGVVHVLSSVSGTTRMAAYVTGASSYHGLCYALGGDAPENDGWNPIFTCPETTTYVLTTILNTAYTTKDAGNPETTESTMSHVSTTVGEDTSHTESNSGTYTDLSTTWKASTTTKEVTTEVTGVSDTTATTRWDGSTTLGQLTASSSITDTYTVDEQPATENTRTKPTVDPETTNAELPTESTPTASKITSEDTTAKEEGINNTARENNLTTRPEQTETPKETLMTTTDNTITIKDFKSTATDSTSTASPAPTTPTTGLLTTKPSHPPKPAQRIQPCYCKQNTPRSSSPKTPAQEEEEEAAVVAVVEELKANLTVARGNTSASIRKVSSAPDDRSSSFAMGAFAIVSLSLVLAVVLSFDFIRFVQWLHAKMTASRSLKQQSA